MRSFVQNEILLKKDFAKLSKDYSLRTCRMIINLIKNNDSRESTFWIKLKSVKQKKVKINSNN